jgi:hypothetical protein
MYNTFNDGTINVTNTREHLKKQGPGPTLRSLRERRVVKRGGFAHTVPPHQLIDGRRRRNPPHIFTGNEVETTHGRGRTVAFSEETPRTYL